MVRIVDTNEYNGPPLGRSGVPAVSIYRLPETVESSYELGRTTLRELGRANPEFALTSRSNHLVAGDKIFRGYIRRSDVDEADPTSQYRLYFMYNPDSLRRSYTAYLNQQALDPSNAMFGSNNMAAAPGIVDFGFELLFDRHIEVSSSHTHPGTKVDYDFFDLVVRGVFPNTTSSGNVVPDNGVMMVNPSNLTVVFGKYLAVRGRAYSASVRFEKFNHRMTPTRMSISISMKAFYVGSVGSSSVGAPDASITKYSTTVEYTKVASNFEESKEGPRFIFEPSVATTTGGFKNPYTLVSTGGTITEGVPPAGIPRGPFNLRIERTSNSIYVNSPVDPVTLSDLQVMNIVRSLWTDRNRAIEAWAIAAAESGFRANVAGVNDDGSIDVGLFQINSINHGTKPVEYWTDPWVNALKAYEMSNGGSNWSPWYVWKYNRVDLAAAREFFDRSSA